MKTWFSRRKHNKAVSHRLVTAGARALADMTVQDLSVSYGARPALDNISFQTMAGGITCVLGPSGCGKSTLLQAMAGLLPVSARLTSGKVYCQQVGEPHSLANVNSSPNVGFVFQSPNPFPLSIAENIKFPLREHGVKASVLLDAIMRRVLVEVGLWDEVQSRLNDSALSLSGGQQQRLCVARAIALSPDVLLLDEPCCALDPIASANLEKLMQQLKGRYTIVMVTHNIAQAARLADQVVVLWPHESGSTIVESGPAQAIFQAPQSKETRLLFRTEGLVALPAAQQQ